MNDYHHYEKTSPLPGLRAHSHNESPPKSFAHKNLDLPTFNPIYKKGSFLDVYENEPNTENLNIDENLDFAVVSPSESRSSSTAKLLSLKRGDEQKSYSNNGHDFSNQYDVVAQSPSYNQNSAESNLSSLPSHMHISPSSYPVSPGTDSNSSSSTPPLGYFMPRHVSPPRSLYSIGVLSRAVSPPKQVSILLLIFILIHLFLF
jgi:hypothetical protein